MELPKWLIMNVDFALKLSNYTSLKRFILSTMSPKKIPQNYNLSSTNKHCRSLSLIKGALQSRPSGIGAVSGKPFTLTISEISRATSGTLVGIL